MTHASCGWLCAFECIYSLSRWRRRRARAAAAHFLLLEPLGARVPLGARTPLGGAASAGFFAAGVGGVGGSESLSSSLDSSSSSLLLSAFAGFATCDHVTNPTSIKLGPACIT